MHSTQPSSSTTAPRPRMPWTVLVAGVLAALTTVVAGAVNALMPMLAWAFIGDEYTDVTVLDAVWATATAVVPPILILVAIGFALARRARARRLLGAVSIGLGVVGLATVLAGAPDVPLFLAISLAPFVIAVLLYLPPSNRWYAADPSAAGVPMRREIGLLLLWTTLFGVIAHSVLLGGFSLGEGFPSSLVVIPAVLLAAVLLRLGERTSWALLVAAGLAIALASASALLAFDGIGVAGVLLVAAAVAGAVLVLLDARRTVEPRDQAPVVASA